ncbi:DUF397 domain-containing protein [Actinomadura sp. NAK00032]|uniref:DUF397 domain-containing protein n=1 Tax=Actinomadura sp. NAK00032 TaxID=2742128 RepID=UPI001591853B|nr:DUF397 domain-containing protein [Actinomadura sp. NAK00032]QKW37891.1 DUF397 domain-containing protein [Actinomadura sp. NAK00032]
MSTKDGKTVWRKSSRSAQGADCVEAAQVKDTRAIRDSKDPTGPVLTFTPDAWTTFLQAVKTGTHDLR